MDKKFQFSKICAFIANALSEYIPRQYVDVMYNYLECVYIVKIKNQFGEAQYSFLWSTVIKYGTDYIVDTIKRDFVFPSECEE